MTSFQLCQTNRCHQIKQIITDEVGIFDPNNPLEPPVAYLQLFNVISGNSLKTSSEPQQILIQLLDSDTNELHSVLNPNFHDINFTSLDSAQVGGLLLTLLTSGTAGGANAIDDSDSNLAYQLIENIILWFGKDCHYYTCFNRFGNNFESWHPIYAGYRLPQSGGSGWSLFKTNYCGDEGVIFVSKSKAGIFWFFGED
jgi:hypothetical protein